VVEKKYRYSENAYIRGSDNSKSKIIKNVNLR